MQQSFALMEGLCQLKEGPIICIFNICMYPGRKCLTFYFSFPWLLPRLNLFVYIYWNWVSLLLWLVCPYSLPVFLVGCLFSTDFLTDLFLWLIVCWFCILQVPYTHWRLLFSLCLWYFSGFCDGSAVKNLPASSGEAGLIFEGEEPLEKEMATHSSILA